MPDPGDPQALNRYSYVLNNPVLYTDPSGHAYDAGGAAGPSCSDGSASFLACTYPASHPLAGYWIGTTQAEADAGWETFATGVEIVAGVLFEPADWAMTVNHWRQGDFHVLDLAGLLPFVPATGVRALRHADELMSLARTLPSPTYVNPWVGDIVSTVAEEEIILYRVWGGDAGRVGAWLSPINPASQTDARRLLALPPGNAAHYVSEVHVPAGTRIQVGTAAPAFGQPGGALQVQLLERIPPSAFGPGAPLPLDLFSSQ